MNIPEMALACYDILKAGGFTTGGLNFDAKIRRQSIDPDDLLIAHVGSMDACARGLLDRREDHRRRQARRLRRGALCRLGRAEGKAILAGKRSLDDLSDHVLKRDLEPQPKSGKQEYLERLINELSLTNATHQARQPICGGNDAE